MKPSLRHVVLIMLALLLAQAAPAGRVLFDGEPPQGILTRADHLLATTTGTLVTRAVPPTRVQQDTYLLAAPEGDATVRLRRLELRNTRSGETRELYRGADANTPLFAQAERLLKLEPFGYFRGVRALRLVVPMSRPLPDAGQAYDIAAYTVEVEWPEAPEPRASGDSALAGGLYREMLDAALALPAAVEAFAVPTSASPHPGPTEWQPDPALSPHMPWLRFEVREDDLIRIDAEWLRRAGVAPGELAPRDIQIVRDGAPVPLLAIPDDRRPFADGGIVVFHARGSSSTETAEGVYFVGGNPAATLHAMETGDAPPPGLRESLVYTRRHVAEEDNLFETRMGAFLSIREMDWLWAPLKPGEPLAVPFALPGLSDGGSTATLRLYFGDAPLPPRTRLSASIAGREVLDAEVRQTVRDYTVALPADAIAREGNTLELRLSSGAPDFAAKVLLDNIALDYRSFPAAEDGRLDFALSPLEPEPPALRAFRAVGFTEFMLAVDATDPARPLLLPTARSEGGVRVAGTTGSATRILLRDRNRIARAPDGRTVAATTLAGRGHSADALVIHHALFAPQAARLAESIRGEGREVLVLDVEAIYNAYSHGETSSTAIRNFLAVAVNEWSGRRPAAAILIGDSTSDGRGEARNGLPNHMPIPLANSTQGQAKEFCSDSVYTWLSGGDEAADLILARLSPSIPGEAAATVANIVAYRAAQDTPQEWASRVVTLVDSGEFRAPVEQAFRPGLFSGYDNRFIHAEEFAWEDNYFLPEHLIRRVEDSKVSPLLTAEIEQTLNEGAAVVGFFGHGAPNLWSNQRFWFGGGTPNSDIPRLRNAGRLPLVASFTCNNAVVDYPLEPWNVCLAEDFMRHEGKGAIACFMPSGPGFLNSHRHMAEGFSNAMTLAGVRSHGVLAELTRLYYQARIAPDDHSRMFIFLGDPHLRLPPPARAGGDYRRERDDALRGEGGAVVIREFHFQGTNEQKALSGVHRWSVVLENQLSVVATATLRATLRDAGGTTAMQSETPLEIAPFATAWTTVEMDIAQPGGYRLHLEIPHASGAWNRPRLPSRTGGEFFVVTGSEGRIEVAPASFALAESIAGRQTPPLQFTIFNSASRPASARLEGAVTRAGEVVHEFAGDYRRYNAAQTLQVSQQLPLGMEFPEPLDVEVRLRELGDEGPGEVYARHTWRIGAESLPDIAIVPDSVRVSPLPLADGLTVFVEAEVENRGAAATPPFQCALFRAEDIDLKEPLRNVTGPGSVAVDPLAPGERRPVRLRWDPTGNAGKYEIALRADSGRVVPEPDKSNNRVAVPLHVRTKSRLYIGEMTVRKGTAPGEVILTGMVGNSGETDARRVAVFFHHSQEQTADTRIGEVLLDRVPAGGTVTAELPWVVDPARVNVSAFQPSFAAALKGSLMRISSIAEADAP